MKIIKIKDYTKVLGGSKPPPPQSTKPKNINFIYKTFNRIKYFIGWCLNPLKTAPFSILFVVFLIVTSLTVLVANHLRMQYFANVLTKAYPEISTVPANAQGKPLYPSIIDKILGEFNSINNVGYLVFFALIFRNFLKVVWFSYNPRKSQVLGRG